MALLGFMRLGVVLLVVCPALSLACMTPDPIQTSDMSSLNNGTVLTVTQADLEQCKEACCNRTDCNMIEVNVNQKGAGPNCKLIQNSQDYLRPKNQKKDQDQVQIYLKIRQQRGRLSQLMIPPVPENRETTGSDDGTEEGSPALNETKTDESKNTETETGETQNTETDESKNTETDESKNTETETGDTETSETKTGEPAQSDQDKNVRCRLPKKVGPCRASLPRFYFNLTSQRCSFFTYGGCQGNANCFDTQEECEDTCEGVTGEVLTDDSTRGSHQINAEVLPSKGVIKPADSPSDSADVTALCFAPPDGGRCRGYFPMFYYDPNTNECHQFIYGGCQGNNNRHSSMEECMNTCSGEGSFGARGQRRNWTAGVFLFVALAAISALLLGALIAITLRRNRLPRRPPSSISDKEELLHDDASSLDSVGIPPSPGQSQA